MELATLKKELDDNAASHKELSSKHDKLNIANKNTEMTIEQMKNLLQEALTNLKTKDKNIEELTLLKSNIEEKNHLISKQNDSLNDTIETLKKSETNLLTHIKKMEQDLQSGFLLAGKVENLGEQNFTQSLLHAVRQEHAKSIERSETILKEEHAINVNNLKRAHELEILNLHHILKLAHIPIPMKGQKFDANNNVIEKGANNDSNTTDDEASKIKKLKNEVRALKSILNSHNKQICSRCGWGWHLFDEVFKLHYSSND